MHHRRTVIPPAKPRPTVFLSVAAVALFLAIGSVLDLVAGPTTRSVDVALEAPATVADDVAAVAEPEPEDGGGSIAPPSPQPAAELAADVVVLDRHAQGARTSTLRRDETAPPSSDQAAPDVETLSRYPAMEVPDRVDPGVPFPLLVWLSEASVNSDVLVQAGPEVELSEDGAIRVSLPVVEGEDTWDLQVVLTAHGFDIISPATWSADIVLPRNGDSTPALFTLIAREGAHAGGDARITATLWHAGSYLASLTRSITINGPNDDKPGRHVAASAERRPVAAAGRPEPDLVVRIDYDDAEAMGPGQIIIASPHLAHRVLVGEIDTPPSAVAWMQSQISEIVSARRGRDRGIERTGVDENWDPSSEMTSLLLEGFGREVYLRYAPELFREVLWSLLDDPDVDVNTIQIYSNHPAIPWELMRPVRGDGSGDIGYLGSRFMVARWHVGDGRNLLDRPKAELELEQVVAIAPDYPGADALPHQTVELSTISQVPGFRRVPARLDAVHALMRTPPSGIIHFAGHGVVEGEAAGRRFSIQLEDERLHVLAWRAMATGSPQLGAFYFFNACDIGQAEQIGNAVDGWGPAVLDAGAGGFIGGLWPVFDDAAADFAARFYTELSRDLDGDGAHVADVLRRVRQAFLETGDPTYLSYVYYGDVNLRLTAP